MKYFTYLLIVSLSTLAACTSPYKKAGDGFEYRVVSSANGKKLVYGNYLEFHITQMYKNDKEDTLLADSRDYMPRFKSFDSVTMPSAYLKMLSDAGVGDSLVLRIPIDSAYKQSSTQMPPFMHKGGFIYTTIKILNIFADRNSADSTERAQFKINGVKIYNKQLIKFEEGIEKNKEQIAADSKRISTYLEKNNIKYIKGKWGTFIVIHDEGTGEKITHDDVVGVNYIGKTLDSGKIFDSNTDLKFDHLGTYEVTMSHLESVMAGWMDALLQLKKGSTATIYIPSSLGYGKKGWPPAIKTNENLVFDIEVKNVITEIRAMEIVSENRVRADSIKQRQVDSLKKIK